MKCPKWLYRRWDERGKIPGWAFFFWSYAHFCPEMDFLLIVDFVDDCCCGWVPDTAKSRDHQRELRRQRNQPPEPLF